MRVDWNENFGAMTVVRPSAVQRGLSVVVISTDEFEPVTLRHDQFAKNRANWANPAPPSVKPPSPPQKIETWRSALVL